MENCLFDRITNRKGVSDFLKNPTKKRLQIRYHDSADGADHFIEWLNQFVVAMNPKKFHPIILQAHTLLLRPDPYVMLDRALASLDEFTEFRKLHHQLRYDQALLLENTLQKEVVDTTSWKKTLNNAANTALRTLLRQNTLSEKEQHRVRNQFFKDLQQRPDLLFIIHIDAQWKSDIHDIFYDLIPQDERFTNKFIFILRHRTHNADLTLGIIQPHHISTYLDKNQKKLNLSSQRVNQFCAHFSEGAKYATVRSKAVRDLGFNELRHCNTTEVF